MKILKLASRIILAVIILTVIFFAALFAFHRISIEKEKKIISEPLGKMVDVDGHKMCVYSEGEGEKTLVFLAGFGSPSPILDFRSLYSLLSDEYRIAVVEKFGYGFSDDFDADRSIDKMLSDTRTALKEAGIEAPYVLCPHSFSGAEAVYWAQTYPDEVEAIISLDAIVPGQYEVTPMDYPLENATKFLSDIGFVRLIPDSDLAPAISNGTLTDSEKEIYMALAHGRFRTKAMMNEVKAAEQNLAIVESGNVPDIPILYYIADMGQTDEEIIKKYRELSRKYTDGKATYIDLDCPHAVQDYEYERISAGIKEFLSEDN